MNKIVIINYTYFLCSQVPKSLFIIILDLVIILDLGVSWPHLQLTAHAQTARMAPVFEGCQITLELDSTLKFKQKAALKRSIIENGGVVSFIVTKKV